jgi:hypothetical protein
MAGRESYEVQVYQDKRWIMVSNHDSQSSAVREAEAVLKARREIDAVRVMRNWLRADGLTDEKAVFTKNQEAGAGKAVSLGHIEEAPFCNEVDELYASDSRKAIGKVLKNYLEQAFLTPLELLHNYGAQRRLAAHDTMLPAAVDRIATLQFKMPSAPDGLTFQKRKDDLFRLVDQATARTRQMEEGRRCPDFDGENVQALTEAVDQVAAKHERRAMIFTSLARHLVMAASWDAKLERLLDLFKQDVAGDALQILDAFLSETLEVAAVIQELLGRQPDLGSALAMISKLAAGRIAEETGKTPPGSLGRLDWVLATKPMPACKTALYARLRRELKSGKRLAGEGGDEKAAFAAVVASLHDGRGNFHQGPEMLEALIDRAGRVYAMQDQAPEALRTLDAMMTLLAEARARIRFLAELPNSPFGKKHLELIVTRLGQLVTPIKDINELCFYRDAPKKKLEEISGLQRAILAGGLPESAKKALVAKLDGILSDFIRREKLIEKLDNPDDPLKSRAERLVQFCASGILIEGNALSIARDHVTALLRQPDFVAKFAACFADAAEVEAGIRQFYGLLAKAGFKS